MEIARTIIQIVFIILSIIMTVIVLMQEGKSAGLGSISGAAETYWGRNKGRSMEGMLVKITKILAVFFNVTCSRTESERILIITKDDTLVCRAYKSVLLYVTIQSHANHANMYVNACIRKNILT
mgnify:CR=1 FL=1